MPLCSRRYTFVLPVNENSNLEEVMQVQHLKPVRLLLEQHAARGQAKVRVQKPFKAILATPRSNELLSLKLSKLTNYLETKMSLRDNVMLHLLHFVVPCLHSL